MAALAALGLLVAGCGGQVDRPVEANVMVAPEAPSPPAGDADEGRRIFVSTCAACHGPQGEGGFGPGLRSSLVAADYDALVEQIREGQGDMPAFDSSLATSEIEDVAAYVNSRLVRAGKKPVAPVTPTTGRSPTAVPSGIDAAAGERIFAQNCAACHGDQGQGTEVGPPIPSDIGFTDTKMLVLGGALGMPAFQQFLGAEEVDQVTAYVVSELSTR